MSPVLISVYTKLLHSNRTSVDAILATPTLREQFLTEARLALGDVPERDLLMCLINLRKRSKLPRSRDFTVAEAPA